MIQSIKLKGMVTQILSLFWWKQFWHYLRILQQANNFAVCTSQSKESCWELTLKKNLQAVFHPWSGNAAWTELVCVRRHLYRQRQFQLLRWTSGQHSGVEEEPYKLKKKNEMMEGYKDMMLRSCLSTWVKWLRGTKKPSVRLNLVWNWTRCL
jgi:hypothetical protein